MLDFSNVFPEDFFGLPLKRKIDLTIDLVPDASPILLPPY